MLSEISQTQKTNTVYSFSYMEAKKVSLILGQCLLEAVNSGRQRR
jgi:hypothetical protein